MAKVAVILAGCGVYDGAEINEAVLTLLHLGVKNIHLGPSLPAFVSPNVLNILVDNFGITPISTADEDLNKLLG